MITRGRGARARLLAAGLVLAAVGVSCTPPPTLTPQQQVDQIIGFVERQRGHEFVTDPDVDFLPDAAFRAEVLASLAAAKPAVDRAEPAFHALGWLATADDLYAKYQIAFGGAVVGFYDPITKVLVVRGTSLTPYRREVIAHELTHALDDQLFALDDDFGESLLGERTFASLVAIEGDAVRVQQKYVASMTPLEQAQDAAEQLGFGLDPELLTVPLALLSLTQAPYLRGGTFASQIAAGGGTAALDAVMERYPSTSEQAFDVARYLANEPAAAVPTPPVDPGGTVVDSGTWGQYLLTMLLQNGLALDAVAPVTRGWAGDSFVTWRNGATTCIRIDTQMDTAAQAAALRDELSSSVITPSSASVVDLGSATTRYTACS